MTISYGIPQDQPTEATPEQISAGKPRQPVAVPTHAGQLPALHGRGCIRGVGTAPGLGNKIDKRATDQVLTAFGPLGDRRRDEPRIGRSGPPSRHAEVARGPAMIFRKLWWS
jgi:hypothetical protein